MDNKLSELKRRADKCPIKRFKAFIGKANTQATLCADTGIEIIGWSGFDASDLNAKSHRVELARFIAAADPETILALLAELEAKKQEHRVHAARLISERGVLRERIAELEAEITNIVDSHAETVAELRAKLEAKDERIGELEAIATEYAGKFQKAQDANKHLVIMSNDDKKRIAELEDIRANASQVFTEIGNELGCNPDNESIMMAIDALKEREKRVVALAGGNADLWETMAARLEAAEAKLATPVRLPTTSGRLGVAYTRVIPEVIEAIRAAGFTVEGDE
ncbi:MULTISPECIES: ead/Ea22-like family protein [unclassified Serratia (in: enterobacteria)]|uniref:ead/Ea22-like family protein n=1 Tax=unclassified Serratia (in: enterobacteria) TaxID=2647522 RepID=UPI0021AD6696|nr:MULTISPECIES: ead/Ea22-like family protein [unclassified Serratia (in: enterobacteria)]